MSEESGFKFGKFVEDNILYFCIRDDQVLRQVRPQLEPEDLQGEIAQQLLRAIYQYYDNSPDRLAPGKFIHDEISYGAQRGVVRKEWEEKVHQLAKNLDAASSKMDRAYMLSRITKFIRGRAFQRTADEFKLRAGRMDVEGCENLVLEIIKGRVGEADLGMDFFSHEAFLDRSRYYEEGGNKLMSFQIAPFNKTGYWCKRSFALVMAPEKRGKTWAGVYIGKCGLLKGLNVLHVTHESGVREKDLGERYEMTFAGMGARHAGMDSRDTDGVWDHETPVLRTTRDGSLRIATKWIDGYSVEHRGRAKEGVGAIQQFGGSLIIKEFERGACSMGRFETFLDVLETTRGWKPHIVINDYPDIMQLPNKEYRHAINDVYEWHSRLAGERNCLVVGFSQVKASAYTKKRITMSDFAEDKRKAAHIDLAWALCQTEEEKLIGRMRLVWVLDRKFGGEGLQAGLVQDLSIGQFCKVAYEMKRLEAGEEDESAES